MVAALTLNAQKRQKKGTGESRALRRNGAIPAIIYGNKKTEIDIAVDAREVSAAFEKGNFLSRLAIVSLEGKENIKVIPCDVQVHPVTDKLLHVDFLRVEDDSRVKVSVPVRFTNIDKAPGVKRGGVLNIVRRSIKLYCKAGNIPEVLTVDVGNLQMGESVHISHLALPEGTEPVISARDFTIASVTGRGAKATTEAMEIGGMLLEEDGEGQAGKEGEAKKAEEPNTKAKAGEKGAEPAKEKK